MKKKILIGMLFIAIIFGLTTGCGSKITKEKYVTKNLEETLTEEQIEHDLSKYKENDKQVTIYMFRGSGCGYCKKFLTFLNSIVDEYGEFFKLESYEVWADKKNAALMEEVADVLETTISGVPFIIIGDQTFPGYSDRYDESIKKAIKDLYNSKERYDIFEELEAKKQEEANVNKHSRSTMLVITAIFIILSTGAIIIVNNQNTKKLVDQMNSLKKELKTYKEEQKEKVKPEETKEAAKQKNKNKK